MASKSIKSVIKPGSAWTAETVERFFAEQRIPIRLACVTPRGGPIVCSLWYVYQDGALWCATQKKAKVVSYLRHNPLCGFEVAPESLPYKGARGQGKVTISEDRGLDILLQLIDRYLGTRESDFARWLIARADSEVAIRIEPTWITTWDFAPRMKPA